MSARPTLISDEIYSYLTKNFSSEDDFLKELNIEAAKENIPQIHISAEQGKFIQFILKAINAKYVLEIGALAGYSAITMARALPDDGKLYTIEIFKKNADFIEKKIKEAGLENKIEVINADAKKFLQSWNPPHELDFVFVDADKKAYSDYLELTAPMIRKGGIFAADNALGFGHIAEENPKSEPGNVKAIQKLNQLIRTHSAFEEYCLATAGKFYLVLH